MSFSSYVCWSPHKDDESFVHGSERIGYKMNVMMIDSHKGKNHNLIHTSQIWLQWNERMSTMSSILLDALMELIMVFGRKTRYFVSNKFMSLGIA